MSSSPSSSNSYRTFTVDPSNNLSNYTNYKIRVTTGVKDTGGNTLSSQYETLIGFTTSSDNSSNSSDNSSSSGSGVFVGVGNAGKIVRSTDNGSSFSAVTPVDSTVLRGVGFATPPVLPVGFCYSDPNNSQWYLAKTADEPGWSSGDSCYTPSGSVTPYGGQSCIGGSGLTSCISACQTAGINCNSQ